MSAWMVSKAHIDALIRVALEGPKDAARGYFHRPYFHGIELTPMEANDLGDCLTKENLSSIHGRYPDTVENPDATPGPCEQYFLEPYTYLRSRAPQLTTVEALKAIDCYEYQACEHKEWETSDAREFCNVLRSRLISVLPGYEAAPWGIDDPVTV